MGKTSKDKRDIYYRMAKEDGWRARSAYKLLQIDNHYHIFKDVKRAVDLCAAPGSWSQVLSKRLYEPCNNDEEKSDVKIIAVDLQAMAPIEGVIQLQGDITKLSTAEAIIEHFGDNRKAQLVICDGAPDVTGLHDIDEYIQGRLLLAALSIATHVLQDGGTFVAKIFRGKDTEHLYSQLRIYFEMVDIAKPASSRNSSIESFVVCRNYKCPEGYVPQMINPNVDEVHILAKETGSETNREIIPFVACGDVNGLDADMTYDIDPEQAKYIFRKVLQEPIDPAYKAILEKTARFNLKRGALSIRHTENGDEEIYSEDYDIELELAKCLVPPPTTGQYQKEPNSIPVGTSNRGEEAMPDIDQLELAELLKSCKIEKPNTELHIQLDDQPSTSSAAKK